MPKLNFASFRRITSTGAFIAEIDGLRCIAIVSVLLMHSYGEMLNRMTMGLTIGRSPSGHAPPLPPMETQHSMLRFLVHGGHGVEIFFAVSGFILALPFARHYLQGGSKVRLRGYFLRRLTRLEPPYVLLLLLRTGLLLFIGVRQVRFLLVHLLASIFYLHNLTYGVASQIEAVSWTLEIEVQFYALAPLLALLYKIPAAWLRRTILLAAIASATPLQRAFLPGWSGPGNIGAWYLSILGFVQFFLVGLLIADLYVQGWERIPQTWKWDVVCFPLWLLMFWLAPHAYLFISPLILPVVFVGAFKGKVIRAVLRHPLVTTIGGMCYSIYLTHRTTLLCLQLLLVRFHLPFTPWLAVSLLLGAASSIAVGAVYFLLIEKPCMDPRWPQKLRARLRPVAQPLAPTLS